MLLERLLDNLAVDVQAFAICSVAPGWRLRVPAREWVSFYYALEGWGEARSSRSALGSVPMGSLVVVPPHLAHQIQCGTGPYAEFDTGAGRTSPGDFTTHRAGPEGGGGLTLACGRLQVLFGRAIGLFDQLREILIVDFMDDPRILTLVEILLEEVRSDLPGSRAMSTALMNESLIRVFRRLCERDDSSLAWLQGLDHPELRPAVTAMFEKPEQPHTVSTLAGLCYMSRSAFARRFAEAFGRAPIEFLRDVRLREAARLLRQKPSPTVRTVASRVGFASRSHFSRAFKEYFDCPPSEFSQ